MLTQTIPLAFAGLLVENELILYIYFHFLRQKNLSSPHLSHLPHYQHHVLAWRIPGTEESSGLPSMGAHRVGHV